MRHGLVVILSAGLVLGLVLVWAVVEEGIDVRGGSEQQRETFAEARRAFTEAGLDLPSMTVILVGDPRVCGPTSYGIQRVGRFRRSWPDATVTICTERLRTMVHELAHAWVETSLETGDRLGFMALRGVDTWRSNRAPWRERGTEHAAEILTWALLDLPVEEVRVEPRDRDSLLAALGYLLEAGEERADPEDFPVLQA